jgi:probable O-glycosylation ligase (exosortase A-associated)
MKGLILIYLITVLGTVGALRWPIIGLYIYVLFAVLRPQFIWGFAGDFAGISLYIGIATLVGWVFNRFGSTKIGPGKSIVAALVLFASWTALSATQAIDTDAAYLTLMPMLKFVVPFLIGITIIDSEQRARGMLWVIVIAMGYVGFEMNLEYVRGGLNIAGEGFGGMDNNCFGVALVSTIGPAIALGLGAKTWYQRVLAAAAAALILHTTLLTFSRGAMVGLLAVGATAFVLMPKRPKYLAVLAVVGLLAIRLTGPQLMARYATTVAEEDERDGSAESRVDLWRDCLKVTMDNPIFGIGPGNFPVIAASLGWTAGKSAHSVWMQQAAETGVPGVLALLLFFGIAVVKLWPIARARLAEENRSRIALASGLIMSIVGFAVAGQFVSLGGLEIPYYSTMIGVVLLKQNAALTSATAASPLHQIAPARMPSARTPVRPAVAMRPLRN